MKFNIINPVFLQAACNHPAGEVASITLKYDTANPIIARISTNGEFKVKSTYNQEPKIEIYPQADNTTLNIQSDANTDIVLEGKFKTFTFEDGFGNKDLKLFKTVGQDELVAANFYQTMVESIELFGVSNDITIWCDGCQNLITLDLSDCINLQKIFCSGAPLSVVKCRAILEEAVNSIRGAINNSTVYDGTVYLNNTDPYYDSVAETAQIKGWTVEAL